MKDNTKRILAAVLCLASLARSVQPVLALPAKTRAGAAKAVTIKPVVLAQLPPGVRSLLARPELASPAPAAPPAAALPALKAADALLKDAPAARLSPEQGASKGRIAFDAAAQASAAVEGTDGAGAKALAPSAASAAPAQAPIPSAASRETGAAPGSLKRTLGAALNAAAGAWKGLARSAVLLLGLAFSACNDSGGDSAPPPPVITALTTAQIAADITAAQAVEGALPQVLTGAIGAPAADAAFRLEVLEPMSLNLSLDGVPGIYFHLVLVDPAGAIVPGADIDNTSNAGASARFTVDLAVGTYYAIIHNNSAGTGNFRMLASRVTAATPQQLEYDASQASLVTQSLPATMTGLLGDSQHDAAYRLSLPQAGTLNLAAAAVPDAMFDLVLLDASGIPVPGARSDNRTTPGLAATVTADLAAGTYFAVLHNNNGAAVGLEYSLTLSQLVPITPAQIQYDIAAAAPLDIAMAGSASGALGDSQHDVSFRIDAPQAGTVHAALGAIPGAIVELLLVDGWGTILRRADNASNPGAALSLDAAVGAGSYYLIVHNVNNATGSYALSASESIAITAAQIQADIAGAAPLPAPPATASGTLGTYQNDRAYRFALSRPQTLALSLPGVAGAALDLLLVDGAGNILARSDHSNDPGAACALSAALQAGTYYAIVHNANSGTGSFSLSLTPTFVPITSAQIQSDIAGALPAGPMPASLSGSLGSWQNDAAYRLSLPQAGTIDAGVARISGVLFDLLIVDAWGNVLARDNQTAQPWEAASVSANAAPGTYYVILHNNNGGAVGATYHLDIGERIPITTAQIQYDIAHAVDAGLSDWIWGYVGAANNDQVYRVRPDDNGHLSVSLGGVPSVRFDLLLVDAYGNIIDRDDNTDSPGSSASIYEGLAPGDYFVIVHNVNNANIGASFSLDLSWDYDTVYWSDSGYLDYWEWYQEHPVEITHDGPLSVSVSGIPDLRMEAWLYDPAGNVVAHDWSSYLGSGLSLSASAHPGGYTLRVEYVEGDGGGSYTVNYTLY